jgi:hypothetical protein
LEPEAVSCQPFKCYAAKITYSMVCLFLEPAVADLTPPPRIKWTTFSNCSIINTYSMVCFVLEPAVADLTPKDIVEDFF